MKSKVNEAPDMPTIGALVEDVRAAEAKPLKTYQGPERRSKVANDCKPKAKPVDTSKPRGPPQTDPEHGAMSMTEFCARYGLNRSFFWKLRQRGQAPEILQVGRRVLITYAAAREWEKRMSNGGAGDAAAA